MLNQLKIPVELLLVYLQLEKVHKIGVKDGSDSEGSRKNEDIGKQLNIDVVA